MPGLVTGLTAERMLQIEAQCITDGAVDLSGHLQLTTHGGDVIDAGLVKGDKGDKGDPGVSPVQSVAGRTGAVVLASSDVGLGNVNNTSDALKPISTATQTALNGKAASVHGHIIGDTTGLQAALDKLLSGDTGRKYRLISGVIRNTGSGWAFIDDSGHHPTGITGISQSASAITINHALGGTRVSSLQITPDETFAKKGIRAGASVGVDSTVISLYDEPDDRISDYITYNGSAWTSLNGKFTVAFSAGILTLSHESMGSDDTIGVAVGNRGNATVQVGAVGDTTTEISFYTGSYGSLVAVTSPTSALCRAYVTRYGRRANLTPANPANIVDTFGNFWITGFIEV